MTSLQHHQGYYLRYEEHLKCYKRVVITMSSRNLSYHISDAVSIARFIVIVTVLYTFLCQG